MTAYFCIFWIGDSAIKNYSNWGSSIEWATQAEGLLIFSKFLKNIFPFSPIACSYVADVILWCWIPRFALSNSLAASNEAIYFPALSLQLTYPNTQPIAMGTSDITPSFPTLHLLLIRNGQIVCFPELSPYKRRHKTLWNGKCFRSFKCSVLSLELRTNLNVGSGDQFTEHNAFIRFRRLKLTGFRAGTWW